MSIGTPIDRAGGRGFRVTGRGGTGGNLAMDNGGGWMEAVSQTSFGHISTNSSMILTVSMATESS